MQTAEAEEESKKKFAKDGENDISSGPLPARGCTDIVCLIIFLVHWLAFLVVTFAGAADGNPAKLWRPRDFRGEYCGLEKNWNDGLNLKDQLQLTYTMNVTKTIDTVAKQLVCSTVAEAQLTPLLTAAQLSTYRCACCKDACSTCIGSLNLDDFTDTSSLSSTVSGRMGEFTGGSNAANLFSSSGQNGDFITGVWNEAQSYFNAVCLPKCKTPYSTDVSTSTRTYTYGPPPDVDWYYAWNVLKTNSNVDAAIRSTMDTSFTFKALDEKACPYHPRYCVPFPGVDFEEVEFDHCTFKMASEVVGAIGDSAAKAYEQIGANKLADAGTESLGDAVGDFLKTLDTFAIVCALSLVIGLIFMVLLRFTVSLAVWLAIFAVFLMLALGGALLWLRSDQCEGTGIFETGKQFTDNSVQSITGSSANEAMTGNGADYRGLQMKTTSGRLCQAWDTQSPHIHTTNSSTYPNAALTSSYCRNPEEAPTIWCFTMDPDVRWETCSPIGVLLPDCPQGYAVVSETFRTVLKVIAVICFALAAIWIVFICCTCRQIRLACAILSCASNFVAHTKAVLLVPLVQILVGIAWCIVWAICAAFVMSQVGSSYVPTDGYATYADVMGTADEEGKCNNMSPAGGAWKYYGDPTSTNDPCSGNLGDNTGITPQCWKCYPPRFVFDVRFWFEFFAYLWNAAFLVAIGQCVIAGAVGVWFFAPPDSRHNQPAVRTGLWNCFRYHLGSLAFGSFILATVQFFKYLCKYFAEQSKAQKNKIMEYIFKCFAYCLWCFEKCVQYLNRQAYIQLALLGKNFCRSAKHAVQLWARNMVRFGILAIVGSMVMYIGYIFIMAATIIVGYFVLQAMHEDVNVILPLLSYAAVSYLIGKLYMNVFGLAVDAMLHCFLAAEEMQCTDCVPTPLRTFMDNNCSKSRQATSTPTLT